MRLMVYARYGRTGIYMMQEYCRLLEIGVSATDLRSLGAALDALPADHPISGLLRRSKDFLRPEAMADALRIPRTEPTPLRRFMLGSIVAACPSVAGSSRLPTCQCGILAGSPHALRLAALPSGLQHAAVELFRGTMVSHSFIAYRDDSAEESQPITFTGDSWRNYIPIAWPWTVCVRERLPPRSVAVLINRSHTFTDLICAVDFLKTGCSAPSTGTEPSAKYFDLRFRTAMASVGLCASSSAFGNTIKLSSTRRAPSQVFGMRRRQCRMQSPLATAISLRKGIVSTRWHASDFELAGKINPVGAQRRAAAPRS